MTAPRFVFHHRDYDATTDFGALLSSWLAVDGQTSALPEDLSFRSALSAFAASADGVGLGQAVDEAALTLIEREPPTTTRPLASLPLVQARLALDRMLALRADPPRWELLGGMEGVLTRLAQSGKSEPRLVPLLEQAILREASPDRFVPMLARRDGARLLAALRQAKPMEEALELAVAVQVIDEPFVEELLALTVGRNPALGAPLRELLSAPTSNAALRTRRERVARWLDAH